MIESSFVHLSGIGELTERSLWDQGVRHWDHLENLAPTLFGAKKAQKCLVGLLESREALEAGEFSFFRERLGSRHAWRMIPFCEDAIAYLDIETTGMGFPPISHSTTVAVSFRGELFVEHDPKRKRELFERLENEVKMWVTFNGLSFDLPFLRREFGFTLAQPHVDLRVWLGRHGFKGGLKKIQMQFPEVRSRSSMDIDGFDAVRLWRMHKRGVPRALETLMTYNAEDTVVLEHLLQLAWQMETAKLPDFQFSERPALNIPKITTEIDEKVYDILRGEASWDVPQGW